MRDDLFVPTAEAVFIAGITAKSASANYIGGYQSPLTRSDDRVLFKIGTRNCQ